MSVENLSERFERYEAYLKQRLSDYKETMPVKWWQGVTLLAIYWEWMDYLVKENLKKKSDLLKRWQRFLMERNTDAIADLLIGFFEAKRRYGRDKERGEDKRDWFTLCKNYCKKNGWNDDELLYSLFSSYSWAERRAYRKVEKGMMLADSSRSILETLDFVKSEMAKKEEEKERKAIERKEKEAEKQRRKEERLRIKEEKQRKEAEKHNKAQDEYIEETSKIVDEWAMNHYRGDDRDIEDENGDIIPNPKYVNNVDEDSIASNPEAEDDNFDWKESENKKRSKKKKSGQQLEFQFGNED